MTGTIYIYSEKHIEIQLSRLNKTQDKLIELCDRNPSLGLMYPEKKFMPKVTSIRKTGDLVFYVLTGDDALDFMDILHSKGGIEFVLESNCPDTKNSTSGIIHAKFDATGLSRAMERIK